MNALCRQQTGFLQAIFRYQPWAKLASAGVTKSAAPSLTHLFRVLAATARRQVAPEGRDGQVALEEEEEEVIVVVVL